MNRLFTGSLQAASWQASGERVSKQAVLCCVKRCTATSCLILGGHPASPLATSCPGGDATSPVGDILPRPSHPLLASWRASSPKGGTTPCSQKTLTEGTIMNLKRTRDGFRFRKITQPLVHFEQIISPNFWAGPRAVVATNARSVGVGV